MNAQTEEASLTTEHDAFGEMSSLLRVQKRNDERSNRGSTRALPEDITKTLQPTRSTEEILKERGKTHGDFTDNARVMQGLKNVIWREDGWAKLTDVQREALEMILHKCGRIISGNPNEPDHWQDIAGYAKLVVERLP